jgi:DNA helicase-2/ATP-dependent DNA helicase PcrA
VDGTDTEALTLGLDAEPAPGSGDPALALLAGLNPAQARAVTSTAAPLCIHAGAGSGKTRVLTRRIAHRIATESADAGHVLALTFTRKAAGELRHRLRRLALRDEVAAGTFHAIAYAQLRSRWADQGREAPTLLERKARFLVPLLPRRERQVSAMEVAGELEWASARMVTAADYEEQAAAAGRRPPLPVDQMARIIDAYRERKREQRAIDFDDLLRLCIRGLESDAEFAAAQRWRFRHLFVDEFQDVNPLQFRLLRGWMGATDDLCVVGDPNQSIYGWNGADARHLDRFLEDFPGGEIVRLDDNYRSSPQILATANAVLAGGPGAPRPLKAHAPDGPLPTVSVHTTDETEAEAIARRARDLHRPGEPWSHQAVLVRTNGQAALLSEAFSGAKIPHRLKGASGLLDRREVQDALRTLDRGPLEAALSDLEAMAAGRSDDHDLRPDGDAVPRPGEASQEDGLAADDGERAERQANIAAIVRLSREYLALEGSPTGAGLVAWTRSTLRAGDSDGGRDAVDIVTFHAAKGLEWPIVHLAGMEDGLVPIGHAKTNAAKAEERRLVYVAVTRAEHELHCSWAQRRTFGSRASDRAASPYLATIERAIEQLGRGEGPTDWRGHLDDNRRRLRADDGGPKGRRISDPAPDRDQALIAALKTWRRHAARAADVQAFVLLDDRALEAVAAARPANHGDLVAVEGIGRIKAERFGDDILDVVRSTDP